MAISELVIDNSASGAADVTTFQLFEIFRGPTSNGAGRSGRVPLVTRSDARLLHVFKARDLDLKTFQFGVENWGGEGEAPAPSPPAREGSGGGVAGGRARQRGRRRDATSGVSSQFSNLEIEIQGNLEIQARIFRRCVNLQTLKLEKFEKFEILEIY